MTALAADRDTRRKEGTFRNIPVLANAKIYSGAIVVVNSSGLAKAGVTGTGLKCPGVAEAQADNTGGADSAISVKVRRGIFNFDNSTSTDAIAEADIGATCYVVDDHTVAKTDGTGTRSAAGKVYEVDADGVWIEFL